MKSYIALAVALSVGLTACASPPPKKIEDLGRKALSQQQEQDVIKVVSPAIVAIPSPIFGHMAAGLDQAGSLFVCGRVRGEKASFSSGTPYIVQLQYILGGEAVLVAVGGTPETDGRAFALCKEKGLL